MPCKLIAFGWYLVFIFIIVKKVLFMAKPPCSELTLKGYIKVSYY